MRKFCAELLPSYACCAVVFTPEEIERFKTDGEFFWRFRRTLENEMNVSTVRSYISLSLSLFGS